ncbi:MAG: hypothetical protein CMB48_07685 [Euryarchaeota archaeon]|nr:hypothetical protein [Euryarchaeota archaeon]
MAIAGTNIQLDATEGMDMITTVEKVTTPYFSGGSETLLAANIQSASNLTATNETYFFGISNTATPTVQEFDVTFGSLNGYGANVEANTKSETEAVYKQYASLLLAPTEVTGGFIISRNNSLATAPSNAKVSSGRDQEIFVLSSRRSNMKDRINKGTWTITLSGSLTNGADGAAKLDLTDDSANKTPTSTPVGDRYNIVSGSAGTISGSGASDRTYGFFYPDTGILVFSATELSASMPGKGANKNDTVEFDKLEHKGFVFSTQTNNNEKTALRFINCLQPTGAKLSFRDEEDQVSAQYFCRVRSGHANFSNNPTFVSGSQNKLRNDKMRGNPQTFITSVQMYNNAGDMVAVGHLSKPLKKNFSSEATIKVKLTY